MCLCICCGAINNDSGWEDGRSECGVRINYLERGVISIKLAVTLC